MTKGSAKANWGLMDEEGHPVILLLDILLILQSRIPLCSLSDISNMALLKVYSYSRANSFVFFVVFFNQQPADICKVFLLTRIVAL
jgi:hypothetical protein